MGVETVCLTILGMKLVQLVLCPFNHKYYLLQLGIHLTITHHICQLCVCF